MELIKDYDMKLHYHPGKANVIADALGWKSYVNTLLTGGLPKELAEDLRELRLEIVPRGFVAAMEVQSTLLGKIREAQKDDKEIAEMSVGTTPMGSQESLLWLAGRGVVRRADLTGSTQFVYPGSGREDA